MIVHVELFGIARHHAGVATLDVEATTLGEALRAAGTLLPALSATCLEGDRLRAGYLANLNGKSFVSDPRTILTAGDSLLILSADPGG